MGNRYCTACNYGTHVHSLTIIKSEKITVPTAMLGVVSWTSADILHPNMPDFSDFPHEHARSRTFRWGEDGIAGVSDTHGLQNIAFAFWNEEEWVPPRGNVQELQG